MNERLSPRQEAFCREYAESGNATAAYSRAYGASTTNSAAASASKLLRNPKILARIKELQDESAVPRIASVMQVKAELSDILRDPTAKDSDRIAAGNVLLRAAGQFVHIQQKDKDEWAISSTTNDDGAIILLPPINPDPDYPEGMEVII